jgi:hypothetical protein
MNSCFLVHCSVLITVTLAAISGGTARADGLTLTAQSGGQYDYGIQLDPNHGLVILAGDQITLTGLFGVTSASVLDGLSFAYSTVVTTPMSVTIVDTTPFVLDPVSASQTISVLRVTSFASTSGLVDYEFQTGNEGTVSGTVLGPVGTVPEPGGLTETTTVLAAFLALYCTMHPHAR